MPPLSKPYNNNPFFKLHDALKTEMGQVDSLIINCLKSESSFTENISLYLLSSGGKRFRPLLALASSFVNKPLPPKEGVYLGATVELIHTATLLHDDVIDYSPQRRGKKSAHHIWGNSASILVGDFLFSKAFELMLKIKNFSILNALAQVSSVISEGELLQLQNIGDLEISFDLYLKIITAKTASLFAVACQNGARTSGANEEICDFFYSFGLNLGIAFQIVDDILDYQSSLFSFEQTIGKDFLEGKITLPIILCRQAGIEIDLIKNCFNDKEHKKEAFDSIKSLLQNHNIFDQCYKVAESYAEKAKESLTRIPNFSLWGDLYRLIDYSIKRTF